MKAASIRTHLLLLVLAMSAPLVATVAYNIHSDQQQAVVRTKASLSTLVRVMANSAESKIGNARQILGLVAERPMVKRVDPSACDSTLGDVLAFNPAFANIGYVNLQGRVLCSAVPQPDDKPAEVGAAPWFQSLLKQQRFTVGQPVRGPITGRWVSVLASPIYNERREMIGAVALPLDLQTYDPNLPARLLPPGSRYGIFSQDGTLIWRNTDPAGAIGSKPTAAAARQIVAVRDGEFQARADDGVERYFAVLPIQGTDWIAFVGVPLEAIHAAARQRAATTASLFAAAIALLLGLAFVIARRITRPAAELERAARAVQQGDLGARAAPGGPREVAAVAHQFNAMVEAQQRSMQELSIAASAFESHEAMMITDADKVILRVNAAFSRCTGYSAAEVVGKTPDMLQSDRHDAEFYAHMWHSIGTTGAWQGEIWDRRKNGEVYPKWLTVTAVKSTDGAVTHYVGTHADISAKKAAEDQIKQLAFYDPLTHLPNRRLLLDRLRQALAAGARSRLHGALLFIDLDNFKALNDTLGHDKGDLLLQQVAERLLACVRECDTVARLGGDEFVVILDGLSMRFDEAAALSNTLGERIVAALNEPYQLAGHENRSTPSIGITLFSGHQASVEDLLKQADLAMYQAKSAGRNTLRFFDPQMQAMAIDRVALEADLREALSRKQLSLHYQPQVTVDGTICGAEALLRWQHPQRGAVLPTQFIGLAEETGLILPIGLWVLQTACEQLAKWAGDALKAHLSIAVNISALQLQRHDFVHTVQQALASTGANPRRLKLELTESVLVADIENTNAKMNTLKALGVGFSLDDFGTGYSSLSYLKRLPLEQLKIDRSFVRDILADPNDAAIAKMIIALAESLGLSVIAEGVETAAQRDFLAGQRCLTYQGHLFGHPVPIEQFEAALERGSQRQLTLAAHV